MAFCKESTIDILLVGKTGHGKSATGNSLLQRKSFTVNNCAQAVTVGTQSEVSIFKDHIIQVVDTPGLCDTRLNNQEDIKQAVLKMSEAMAINPEGYHAIIFVVKFGIRFTAEDVDSINILKKIFGVNFFRNHGILLFTYGDEFEADDEDPSATQTFEAWLANQTEPNLQALIRECGSRTILFNNKLKDESQIEKLMEIIIGLRKDKNRYSSEIFQCAKKERDRMLRESKIPYLIDDLLKGISLITQKLGHIEIEPMNLNKTIINLHRLGTETDFILESLKSANEKTKSLEKELECVLALKKNINDQRNQIILLQSKFEEEEKARLELEDAKLKLMKEEETYELRQSKGKNECRPIMLTKNLSAPQTEEANACPKEKERYLKKQTKSIQRDKNPIAENKEKLKSIQQVLATNKQKGSQAAKATRRKHVLPIQQVKIKEEKDNVDNTTLTKNETVQDTNELKEDCIQQTKDEIPDEHDSKIQESKDFLTTTDNYQSNDFEKENLNKLYEENVQSESKHLTETDDRKEENENKEECIQEKTEEKLHAEETLDQQSVVILENIDIQSTIEPEKRNDFIKQNEHKQNQENVQTESKLLKENDNLEVVNELKEDCIQQTKDEILHVKEITDEHDSKIQESIGFLTTTDNYQSNDFEKENLNKLHGEKVQPESKYLTETDTMQEENESKEDCVQEEKEEKLHAEETHDQQGVVTQENIGIESTTECDKRNILGKQKKEITEKDTTKGENQLIAESIIKKQECLDIPEQIQQDKEVILKSKSIQLGKESVETNRSQLENQRYSEIEMDEKSPINKAKEICKILEQKRLKLKEEREKNIQELVELMTKKKAESEENYQNLRKTQSQSSLFKSFATFCSSNIAKILNWRK